MQSAVRYSCRVAKTATASFSAPSLVDPSKIITSKFSTAAVQQEAGRKLKNRPLSPFLSQKRPEKSSTLSIGERMVLITSGLVILPAIEIAKMSLFMY